MISKTIHKYRKHFPSLKVYVCFDPADWDAPKSAKTIGKVRVQLDLNDCYGSRIYEKSIKPRSDATIEALVEKMCRKAIRDHVKSLRAKLKKAREDVKETKGKVALTHSEVKKIRSEMDRFTRFTARSKSWHARS